MENLKNIKDGDIGTFSLDGEIFVAKVTNVYDADTCKTIFNLNNRIVKFTCRLYGIDTPEIRPKKTHPNREEEKKKALISRNRLIQLSTNVDINLDNKFKKKKVQKLVDNNSKLVLLKCHKFDKYGRLLAELFDYNGENLEGGGLNKCSFNQKLVEEGYAKEYFGGTKK